MTKLTTCATVLIYLSRACTDAVTAQSATNGDIDYPAGWEDMEVEAKWVSSRDINERILAEMSSSDDGDGDIVGELLGDSGYRPVVRWGGTPRLYVDYYYDTADGAISKASSHALRHRTRSSTSSYSPLDEDGSEWEKDWEKIQYKSTPHPVGAVWFRTEVGECYTWIKEEDDSDDEDSGLCPNLPTSADAEEIITDPDISHDALSYMLMEHPDVDRADLRPVLAVTDFRHRVVLKLDGEDKFEISLDRFVSHDLLEAPGTTGLQEEYEVELEIIADSPDEEDLAELFRAVAILEERYGLEPSTTSKGGNDRNNNIQIAPGSTGSATSVFSFFP